MCLGRGGGGGGPHGFALMHSFEPKAGVVVYKILGVYLIIYRIFTTGQTLAVKVDQYGNRYLKRDRFCSRVQKG